MASAKKNGSTESESNNGETNGYSDEERAAAKKALPQNVKAWAEGQKKVEQAKAALEAAQAEMGGYAEQIHMAIGSEVFSVKGLKRDYRAMHIGERTIKGAGGAPDTVVPAHFQIKAVPDLRAKREF